MKKLRKTLTVFCLALVLNLTPFASHRLIVFSDESLADEECETDDCAGDEEDVPVDDPLDITDYREWNSGVRTGSCGCFLSLMRSAGNH